MNEMGNIFIESTNLETAQQLAMLILRKTDISTMTIEEITAKFISDTNPICICLNNAFK